MKQLFKTVLVILLCAVMMLSVTSCTAENELVGRWRQPYPMRSLPLVP